MPQDLHNMLVGVSVIKKRGKLSGSKLLLETPQVDRSTLQIRAKYACTHNCSRFAAVDVLREGLVRPSATELPDWIYTPGFYCWAAICQTHDESSFQQALNEALAKASKYSSFSNMFSLDQCVSLDWRWAVNLLTLSSIREEPPQTMGVFSFLMHYIVTEANKSHFDPIYVKCMAWQHPVNRLYTDSMTWEWPWKLLLTVLGRFLWITCDHVQSWGRLFQSNACSYSPADKNSR